MKFHWFHLMPYRELPEDFKTRYRSVWVDVPQSLFDPGKARTMYNDYLDELEFAEQVGFDGICVNEHHQNAYGLMPSPNLMAAMLSRRTNRAALVLLGNSLALYNPPVRVAEEMAMLDVISGGRVVAGFPVGSSMDTNFTYGVNPATLRDRYYEAHDLIVRAWTNPEPFSFNGKYTQLRYVNLWPQPIQEPHPPIWVPGGGSIETWEWTTRLDYVYCYLSYYGHRYGKKVVDGFWQKVEELGYERNPYRLGFLQIVAIAESDEQAEKIYGPALDYFYNRCLHVYPGFAEAPGYRTIRSLQSGLVSQFGSQARDTRGKLTWKDFVERGYVIAGNPATVRDQLKEVVKDFNLGQLMVLNQFGNLSHEQALENTERFAKEVMPALRGLHSDWEDRWYPQGARTADAVTEPVMARSA